VLSKEEIEYLTIALSQAELFKKKLIQEKQEETPKIAVLAGNFHPTTTRVLVENGKMNFDLLPKDLGDTRISLENATPKNLSHKLYVSKEVHSSLLNDPQLLDIIDYLLN